MNKESEYRYWQGGGYSTKAIGGATHNIKVDNDESATSKYAYETDEFVKKDNGKPRYSLIPPIAEFEMVRVLTFGANKYSADNWKNCDDLSRYVDAALRHVAAYRRGDVLDDESGLHHLAHAMCCLSFIVDIELDDTRII